MQTSNYLQGVWEVTGKQKKDIAQVVESRKLDYELLERWIKYMAKPTDKYKYKDAWQAMMKKDGGTRGRGEETCQQFQDDVVAGDAPEERYDAQNKVIADKDLEAQTQETHRQAQQLRFEQGFQSGALIFALKSLPDEQNNFWIEIFQRELKDNVDPERHDGRRRQGKPGVLLFRGWGLESRAGAGTAGAREDHAGRSSTRSKKKLDPSLSVHSRREGLR